MVKARYGRPVREAGKPEVEAPARLENLQILGDLVAACDDFDPLSEVLGEGVVEVVARIDVMAWRSEGIGLPGALRRQRRSRGGA